MYQSKIKIFIMTLFCLLLIPVNSSFAHSEQTEVIPNTRAGKQLTDWLRVFAAGNQDKFTSFLAERYSKALLEI